MWSILIFLCIGVAVGAVVSMNDKALNWVGRLQLICLYFIIFVMGLKIGLDQRIFDYIGTLGLQALLFASLAVAGSVALAYGGVRIFLKQREGKRDYDLSDNHHYDGGSSGGQVDAAEGIDVPS